MQNTNTQHGDNLSTWAQNGMETMFDALDCGVVIVDAELKIYYWNHWFATMVRRPFDAKLKVHLHDFVAEDNIETLSRVVPTVLASRMPFFLNESNTGYFVKIALRQIFGSHQKYRHQRLVLSPLARQNNYVLIQFVDDTHEQEWRHNVQQFHGLEQQHRDYLVDKLTGLYNRVKLLGDVHAAQHPLLAILSIDLFHDLSKFYGYDMGDWLLKEVAARLAAFFDGEHFEVYKLPVAEYAVLMKDGNGLGGFVARMEQFLVNISRSKFFFREKGQHFPVSFTVGFASNKGNLLRHADLALKAAVEKKKSCLVFDESMDDQDRFEENIRWLNIIKDALDHGRIRPVFQPIVDNRTGEISKYEVLARLIDNTGRMIAPYYFLNIAKQAKLYPDISRSIIDQAFRAFEGTNYDFSINLSVDDILEKETHALIYRRLSEQRQTAQHVVFEILESEGIENFQEVSDFIKNVKEYGAKIAIDDFGTGYSNFDYLIKLDVDFIKIDGSLIKNLDHDRNALMVVETLVEFTRKFGIQTVAEFVDSNNVLQVVKELGITYSQGFFLGKPAAEIYNKEEFGNVRILDREHLFFLRQLANRVLEEATVLIASLMGPFALVEMAAIDLLDNDKLQKVMKSFPLPDHRLATLAFTGTLEGELFFQMDQNALRELSACLANKSSSSLGEHRVHGIFLENVHILATSILQSLSKKLHLNMRLGQPSLIAQLQIRPTPLRYLMIEASWQFHRERVQEKMVMLIAMEQTFHDLLEKTMTSLAEEQKNIGNQDGSP